MKIVILLALLFGCSNSEMKSKMESKKELIKLKFKFGDRVCFETEFYGKCEGEIKSYRQGYRFTDPIYNVSNIYCVPPKYLKAAPDMEFRQSDLTLKR